MGNCINCIYHINDSKTIEKIIRREHKRITITHLCTHPKHTKVDFVTGNSDHDSCYKWNGYGECRLFKDIDERTYTYEKLEEFLYSAEFNISNDDEAKAIKYFEDKFHNKDNVTTPSVGGGCSSVRNGNFFGRNYDWYYNNRPTFVIHNNASEGRFESIGVAQAIFDESEVTKDSVEMVAFYMLDGVNSEGLFVNNNVVPSGDMGSTTGTHESVSGDYICQLMLPRYLLDHFATAAEAVEWIQNEGKIYAPKNANVNLELHFMVGDKNNTYIVEFINNEAVVTEVINSNKEVMTNFYIQDAEFDSEGNVDFDSVTNYGTGLERYNTLIEKRALVTDVTTMRECMDSAKYTKAYTEIFDDEGNIKDTCWKTEFAGNYTESERLPVPMDLHANSPLSDYITSGIFNVVYDDYINRTREDAKTWQTVHSSVYDLENKKLYLRIQEQLNDYQFGLSEPDEE